jgi:uncharacterized protein
MTERNENGAQPTIEDIQRSLRSALPGILRRYGVTALGIFGSYSRGEQNQGSDLDLLVGFDSRPLTLLQFIALENELSDRLGVRVDLVEKGTLKPAIGRHILSEALSSLQPASTIRDSRATKRPYSPSSTLSRSWGKQPRTFLAIYGPPIPASPGARSRACATSSSTSTLLT